MSIDPVARAIAEERHAARTQELTGGMFRVIGVSERVRALPPRSIDEVIVDNVEYDTKPPFFDVGAAVRLKWMVVGHEGECDIRTIAAWTPLLPMSRVAHHLVFLWKLPRIDQIFGRVFTQARVEGIDKELPKPPPEQFLPIYFHYEKTEELE